MKKSLCFLLSIVLLAMVLGISMQAHADLYNRGTDSLGNRLIYDSDLNITWYDYTEYLNGGQNYLRIWASGLSVNFGGTLYNDWRLPRTFDQNCTGYNCTNSEMGHLFYTELGNAAGSLDNVGPFMNLQAFPSYWSGTYSSSDPDLAWTFTFSTGNQNTQWADTSSYYNAIAVRSGDVSVVPEPISSILFITGGTLFVGRNFLCKRRRVQVKNRA